MISVWLNNSKDLNMFLCFKFRNRCPKFGQGEVYYIEENLEYVSMHMYIIVPNYFNGIGSIC